MDDENENSSSSVYHVSEFSAYDRHPSLLDDVDENVLEDLDSDYLGDNSDDDFQWEFQERVVQGGIEPIPRSEDEAINFNENQPMKQETGGMSHTISDRSSVCESLDDENSDVSSDDLNPTQQNKIPLDVSPPEVVIKLIDQPITSLTSSQESLSGPKRDIITRFDGTEIEMVTVKHQTDWFWVEAETEKMRKKDKKGKKKKPKKKIPKKKLDDSPPEEIPEVIVEIESEIRAEPAEDIMLIVPDQPDQPGNVFLTKSPSVERDTESEKISSEADDPDKDSDKLCLSNGIEKTIVNVGPPEILMISKESDEREIDLDSLKEGKHETSKKCQFCNKTIKPFPSLEMQQSEAAEDLSCCERYRTFIEQVSKDESELFSKVSSFNANLSVKSGVHFSSKDSSKPTSKTSRKKSHLERKSQQSMQLPSFTGFIPPLKDKKSKLSSSSFQKNDPIHPDDIYQHKGSIMQPINLAGRQMKTVNYQLSSERCYTDGWTVPFWDKERRLGRNDVYTFNQKPLKIGRRMRILWKKYEDGKTFLTMFKDGSGLVSYPSGRPAIIIIPVTYKQFAYVVRTDERLSTVLATFDPSGFGTCSDSNGVIRLNINAIGGTLYDEGGAHKCAWNWKDLSPHVHAPPLQPIVLKLTQVLSLRIISQSNVILTFFMQQYTCRFNVGCNLQVKEANFIPFKEYDIFQHFLNEKIAKTQTLLDRINNVIRFPHSAVAERILPPLYLTNKANRLNKLNAQSSQLGLKQDFYRPYLVIS